VNKAKIEKGGNKQSDKIGGQYAERCLVVIRAGTDHRIEQLLGISREHREWDLAISLYENVELADNVYTDFLHHHKGGKWDGIYAFFAENPELVFEYDYFWLVDDDIEATPFQVDAMFKYVHSHQFELAQPALTLDSFYSHRLTLQCPGFSHRLTNFVELMLPVLSRRVLREVLPLFKGNWSGLGIDWMWYQFVERNNESVAIIDTIAMLHQRPLNRHLRGRMKQHGICAIRERAEAWHTRRVYPVAFAGARKNGELVRSRYRMSLFMTESYWKSRELIVRKKWRFKDFLIFAYRQAFYKRE
jgi:hypothetical protein